MPAITDNDAFSNVWTTITMNVRNGSKMIWETQTATQGVTLTEDIENIEDMFFVFELNPDGQSYNVKAATTDLPNEVVIPVYKYDNPDIFVTAIAPRGFENCKHLKTLMIPPSLKTIGNLATIGCDSLYSIRLDDFGSSWMSADYLATKDGSVYSKDMTKLVLKPNAKTFSIPAGVTELCDFSVPLSKSNTRITIPTGVKKIGTNAFWNNPLTEITLSSTVKELGTPFVSSDYYMKTVTIDESNPYFTVSNNVIYSKDKTTVIGYGGGSNNGILTIDEGATKIRENAFSNSKKISGLNIPASMEEIPDNFANDVYYFQGAYVDENNPFYASIDDKFLLTKDMTRLIKAGTYEIRLKAPENVSKIEIPEGVTVIGKNAVRYSITKLISLPTTLKEIEDSAFYNCKELMTVNIPASVETIGNSAFENCTDLESVVIGTEGGESALASLGENAFAGCQDLSNVVIYSVEPPTAPESAFSNYNASLTVAKGSRSEYQNAGTGQAWANFATVSEHETAAIEDLASDIIDENEVILTTANGSITLSGYNGSSDINIYYCCPIKIEDSTKAWLNC